MIPDDIHRLTRATPFKPFRVTLTTGEEFDIRHPDLIIATYGSVIIARPQKQAMNDGEGSFVLTSIEHIVKIENLTAGSAPPLDKSTV